MSHQKKNPCYIKFLFFYWLESSSRRNEKCWTWFLEQGIFFQLQVGEQAIVPAKQMQLFPDQLYFSDFKSNKFAGGKNIITLNIHLSQKSTRYVIYGGNTFEINIPIQVNQIPSVPKWVNFFAQCHGIFLRQKCREWWMFLHGFTWRYYEMQHRNYRWNFHVLCPTGGQAGWGWQYFLLALEKCICENTIRAYGPLDPCALKWLFSTKNDIICKNK